MLLLVIFLAYCDYFVFLGGSDKFSSFVVVILFLFWPSFVIYLIEGGEIERTFRTFEEPGW